MLTFSFRSIALLLLLLLPAASVPLTEQAAQAQTPAGTDQQQPSDDEAGAIGFTSSTVRWQKNSPVQVVGIESTGTDIRRAILFNTGSSRITSLRLGCYFEGKPKGEQTATRFLYLRTRDIPLSLAPGQLINVKGLKWVVDRTERYVLDVTRKNEIEAVVGVISVRLANGRRVYSYNLSRSGSFQAVSSRGIETLYNRVGRRRSIADYFSRPVRRGGRTNALGERYYACKFTGKPYHCENTVDNCRHWSCHEGEPHCEMQTCEWLDRNRPRPRPPGGGDNNWCPIPGYPTMCYGYTQAK